MGDRFAADQRMDGPVKDAQIPIGDRGGTGQETDGPESDATAAHSSRGFKRALLKAGHDQGTLPDKIKSMAKVPHKRQGFAQGGGRHGLHLGNGGIDTGRAKVYGKKGGKKY